MPASQIIKEMQQNHSEISHIPVRMAAYLRDNNKKSWQAYGKSLVLTNIVSRNAIGIAILEKWYETSSKF